MSECRRSSTECRCQFMRLKSRKSGALLLLSDPFRCPFITSFFWLINYYPKATFLVVIRNNTISERQTRETNYIVNRVIGWQRLSRSLSADSLLKAKSVFLNLWNTTGDWSSEFFFHCEQFFMKSCSVIDWILFVCNLNYVCMQNESLPASIWKAIANICCAFDSRLNKNKWKKIDWAHLYE